MKRIFLGALAFAAAQVAWADDKEHCKSENFQYDVCEDNIKDAWLEDQDSDAPCIEGHSWGVNGNGQLWVNHGCEGDFRVVFGHQGGDSGDRCEGVHNCIPCDSHNSQYAACGGGIASAWVAHVYSKAECRWNHSWGISNGQLWVNRGCRADFSVEYGWSPPPVNPPVIVLPPPVADVQSCGAYAMWNTYSVPGSGEVFKHSIPGSDKFWAGGGVQGQIVRVQHNLHGGCILTVEFWQSQVSFIGSGDFNPTGRTSGLIQK